MIDIWIIAAILAGIILLGAAYNLFWVIVETVHPFTYRQVPLGEVHDYILVVFRRGLNRTQMLITCEQSGKQLRFCKTYKYGQQGIAFHLIVPALTRMESGLSQAITAIEALGLRCAVISQKRSLLMLDIDCLASVEKANAVADIVLLSIVGASDVSTFSVRVKGGFFGVDGYIGGETKPGEIAAMYRCAADQGDKARPYKWEHYCVGEGTWARSLGAAVGRIAAWLLPPRK